MPLDIVGDIHRDHGDMGTSMDKPAAALLKDLKQRGLLDDTIVIWTTEFGRMPCTQGGKGRDHNPFVFTNWMAGGGKCVTDKNGYIEMAVEASSRGSN